MLGNIPNFPQEKKKQAGGITPGETTDIIVKIEIKEEPCRIKDEDTEEQIGWCFPSFLLMTDEEH